MIPWRGRLSFCQYIPGKVHKYGVKLYKLCTVKGYTWNLKVYCGKKCERQFYNVEFRKCCNDTDEGFVYDWKRATRRQFLHKLIFDRNFVCNIHFRVTRNKMQMLRFREALIVGMVTKQNKEENLPTTSCSSISVAGRNSEQKHQLSKYECTDRTNRKRCTACYRKVQENEGAGNARK